MIRHKLLSYINNFLSNRQDIDTITYSKCDKVYPVSESIDFDWKNSLDNPPKNSSSQTLRELIFVSGLTQNRSEQELLSVRNIVDDPAFGVKKICKEYNIEFPQQLFDQYYDTTKNLVYAIKCLFNRPRPYQLAKIYNMTIDVIESKTANTPAYPSGHTVYAKLASLIIGQNHPELYAKLDLAVLDVAYARCLQGVHFPSDNKASIVLAEQIFNNLEYKLQV